LGGGVETYKELKAQLAELELLAATARQTEYQAVLDDIRAKVAEFGFTEPVRILGSMTSREVGLARREESNAG